MFTRIAARAATVSLVLALSLGVPPARPAQAQIWEPIGHIQYCFIQAAGAYFDCVGDSDSWWASAACLGVAIYQFVICF
jgi:hypothetical protein